MALRALSRAAAFALLLPACESGESTGDASGGDGGTAGSPSSTTTASGGAGGDSSSTSTADSSSATGMRIPCTPLKNADATSPTPGRCENGAAVTCGQDGFLETDVCTGADSCQVYSLDEHRFNGSSENPAWLPARTIDWAACLPPGEPCPMEWTGNYYIWLEAPRCEGTDRVRCYGKPAPDLYSNYPQMQFGSEEGWRRTEACPSGQRCAGSNNLDELTCIDEATPDCDGNEPRCVGNGIEHCVGAWESEPGYKVVQDCGAGLVCYEGTQGPFCQTPGEVPCVDGTPAACNADNTGIVGCYNGFTTRQSCATCMSNGQQVPCRCDSLVVPQNYLWTPEALLCIDGTGTPTCVPQASADCDPANDADTCQGNVAHRCVGHWEDIDCGALGMVCGVGSGVAGCRDATAQACEPATVDQRCDGNAVVACCRCGTAQFLFGPGLEAPCVTGFEVRSDCTDLGPMYQCETAGFSMAECRFNP